MTVRVLLFGSIAAKCGRREYALPACDTMSLADVIHAVDCEQVKPLLLAVNQVQVDDRAMLIEDGDEVAIMPPFSGG